VRILHLVNHIQRVGNGIVNVAIDLACSQSANGCKVAVASGGGNYDGLLARNGVRLIPFEQRISRPASLATIPWRWRAVVRDFQPDVVHAHMVAGAVIARYCRGSAEYKLVTTVHNEHEAKSKLMSVGQRVITVSRSNLDSLVKRGIDRGKLRVVVNGTLGSPRNENSSADIDMLHHPAVMTVAGLYVRKGIADLITAFDTVADNRSDVHLYIVGDGPDRKQFLNQAAAARAANRIHFLGFHDKPQSLMRQADVFVLASHREPFGLVITEAMEAGCPVIGSDVDGIPEILGRNGEYGHLVPPANPARLAEAIETVLGNDDYREALSRASVGRAKAFTVERVARQTQDVYQELMHDPAFPRSRDLQTVGAGHE
jgi:glycosyltransferase involved in cell wall biosynthesis